MIKNITDTSIEIPEETEVIDVCKSMSKAIEDLLKESREQGIEIGKIQTHLKVRLNLLKKFMMDWSLHLSEIKSLLRIWHMRKRYAHGLMKAMRNGNSRCVIGFKSE